MATHLDQTEFNFEHLSEENVIKKQLSSRIDARHAHLTGFDAESAQYLQQNKDGIISAILKVSNLNEDFGVIPLSKVYNKTEDFLYMAYVLGLNLENPQIRLLPSFGKLQFPSGNKPIKIDMPLWLSNIDQKDDHMETVERNLPRVLMAIENCNRFTPKQIANISEIKYGNHPARWFFNVNGKEYIATPREVYEVDHREDRLADLKTNYLNEANGIKAYIRVFKALQAHADTLQEDVRHLIETVLEPAGLHEGDPIKTFADSQIIKELQADLQLIRSSNIKGTKIGRMRMFARPKIKNVLRDADGNRVFESYNDHLIGNLHYETYIDRKAQSETGVTIKINKKWDAKNRGLLLRQEQFLTNGESYVSQWTAEGKIDTEYSEEGYLIRKTTKNLTTQQFAEYKEYWNEKETVEKGNINYEEGYLETNLPDTGKRMIYFDKEELKTVGPDHATARYEELYYKNGEMEFRRHDPSSKTIVEVQRMNHVGHVIMISYPQKGQTMYYDPIHEKAHTIIKRHPKSLRLLEETKQNMFGEIEKRTKPNAENQPESVYYMPEESVPFYKVNEFTKEALLNVASAEGKEDYVGLLHQMQKMYPTSNITQDQYFDILAQKLDTDEKMAAYFQLFFEYAADAPEGQDFCYAATYRDKDNGKFPTPEETLKRLFEPGNNPRRLPKGINGQKHSYAETTMKPGAKMLAHCGPQAEFARKILEKQGTRAYVLGTPQIPGKKNHAFCLWLDQDEQGLWHAKTLGTFGFDHNGVRAKLQKKAQKVAGFDDPQDAVIAVLQKYRNNTPEYEGINFEKLRSGEHKMTATYSKNTITRSVNLKELVESVLPTYQNENTNKREAFKDRNERMIENQHLEFHQAIDWLTKQEITTYNDADGFMEEFHNGFKQITNPAAYVSIVNALINSPSADGKVLAYLLTRIEDESAISFSVDKIEALEKAFVSNKKLKTMVYWARQKLEDTLTLSKGNPMRKLLVSIGKMGYFIEGNINVAESLPYLLALDHFANNLESDNMMIGLINNLSDKVSESNYGKTFKKMKEVLNNEFEAFNAQIKNKRKQNK